MRPEEVRDRILYSEPDILATEIVENMEAGLESFREIANNLE